ncbi:helix-turn-helix transcriptional regulator [Halorubrum sp. RMP-47]|uniref:Helix-turn-helix transcriptional regulator n=1 Tax=Halorubrum miltondacostae TaxID=3076378 RepID=A0ABD5M0M8_9EURY
MRNDVREHREAAGLSQGDLAAALAVSRQTVNAIERERYDPSIELAFKLARFFDCHIDELFDPDLDWEPPEG